MNQQDIMGVSADTMAVVCTGLQTQQLFQFISLFLTVLSIIFGITLKIISAVKDAKAKKELTDEEKAAKIAELEAENKKLQEALEKATNIFESGSKLLPKEKKGA